MKLIIVFFLIKKGYAQIIGIKFNLVKKNFLGVSVGLCL